MRRPAPLAAPALLLVALLSLPTLPAHACSMCSCGDPSYRMVGEDFFGASPWRLGLDLDHTGKDTAAEMDGMRENELETRVTPSVSWSRARWLRMVARVPVVRRRIGMGDELDRMTGLGDPELFAHAQVTPRSPRGWAAVMLGVRAPWGQNDRTVDGVRAEEHLQPGTGAASLWAGASGAIRLGTREHLYVSAMARWNGVNAHGYRYGNAAFANLAYQRDLAPRLAGVFELNGRDARADVADDVTVEHTGGRVLYVSPRVQWQMNEVTVLRLGVQVPVAQRLFGDQNEHANLITGITLAY